MNLATKVLSIPETGTTTIAERTVRACDVAKQFEKMGEYEAAYEALREFWPDRNAPPTSVISTVRVKQESYFELVL